MKKLFFSFAIVVLLMSGCYKDDINDLNKKYDDLKKEQEQLRQDYETVRTALQNQVTVTSVNPTADGYRVTFSDGKTVDLKHGADGANGTNGADGADAPSIVEIIIEDGNVAFMFSNGDTIVIPMTGNFACFITSGSVQGFEYGETREFAITRSGVLNMAIARPDGWKVSVNGEILTVTAPEIANTYADFSGIVSIIATGDGATAIASMDVHVWEEYLIDFENPDVSGYLAGPTAAGENLYESAYMNPEGIPIIGAYQDEATGLYMKINEAYGETNFWNGGVAISQWNDMVTEGLSNQCSVYYSDGSTGFGGYEGSQTFAVANGDGRISFEDGVTECKFDHFRVTNSTYAALSMENGDDYAKKFSYDDEDWLKLIITAEDKDGNPTGVPVEFYLADFRTISSTGIVTEWETVDLTPLGSNVHTVKFGFESSDTGQWGMNTPGYFCFDNLAIKK